jgi:O-antigen biosynthesis protein
MPSLSVIVPVQQDPSILDLFLSSLAQTTVKPTQVVLIEDGAQPGLVSVLDRFRNEMPLGSDVVVLKNETPRGYAASVNRALQVASEEIVVMADSDLILLPGWQEGFEAAFDECADAGAIGAKLLYPQSGGIQHCGLAFSEDMVRHLWLNSPPSTAVGAAFPVQAVVFALCAIRRAALKAAGDLDECYFNGYEDLDFCMRVRAAGFQVLVAPEVKAYHWERSNGVHRDFNRRRNLGRFWRLRGSAIEPDIWRFLSDALRRLPPQAPKSAAGWVLIDLCEDRSDVVHIKKTIASTIGPIDSDRDYSFRLDSGGEIWLPRVLGRDGHLEPSRYVFAVQNIVRLTPNRYWWDLRSAVRDDDVVVDLYGNALGLKDLIASAWPGSKIR